MIDLADMLPKIEQAARRAGDAIMEIYATDFEVEQKDDASPVTAADVAAEAIILEALRELTPGPVSSRRPGAVCSVIGMREWRL